MSVFNTLKTTYLLGVPIKHATRADLPNLLKQILSGREFHHIVTANPEILLTGQQDKNYHDILRTTEACLADGFGLLLMSWFVRPTIPERVTGSFLVNLLFRLAHQNAYSVFVLLPEKSLTDAQELVTFLQQYYPGLNVSVSLASEDKRQHEADIVFSALGHPEQETWLADLRAARPNARIAVGVGGVFDFLSGAIRRAPRCIQIVGLEWLWRMLLEPRRRWKRIINAVIIFPLNVIRHHYAK